MKIDIIGTGSNGNCFMFNDSIMIDAGLPIKKIKEKVDVSKITHVLLTHIHPDHLNKTTIRKMFVDNRNIIFMCGSFLVDSMYDIGIPEKNIIEVRENVIYDVGIFKVSPFSLYHDVQNFGYRLAKDGHKHIHATDTSTLYGISAKDYDTATIECNHHLPTALAIIDDAEDAGKFTHLKGAINSHLNVEETIQFCKRNNIKKLYPIHIGLSTKREVIDRLKAW